MVGLLLTGFVLWLSSPLIAKFFEYIEPTALSPIGEWICKLFGLEWCRSEGVMPFVVSEYFSRMEKAALDILEVQKPVDRAIVLWWGLDGLRLNEGGTLEWVSRKKNPVETTPYQMCRLIQPIQVSAFLTAQTQCTRVQIDALMAQNTALQMQAWQSAQIANTIQQCCVQYLAQYPSYYYGGCCRLN